MTAFELWVKMVNAEPALLSAGVKVNMAPDQLKRIIEQAHLCGVRHAEKTRRMSLKEKMDELFGEIFGK